MSLLLELLLNCERPVINPIEIYIHRSIFTLNCLERTKKHLSFVVHFGHYPSRSGLRGGAAGLRADSERTPAEPPDSARTPAERRQNIFRMDSKLFLRTPADSERTPADSRRTLKSAADSERLRGGPVECPPRTKPVADSTPLADSGGEVGGSAADSTADLNPAESAGLQSPLGVRGGVRRLPTESTDFQPSAKFVT